MDEIMPPCFLHAVRMYDALQSIWVHAFRRELARCNQPETISIRVWVHAFARNTWNLFWNAIISVAMAACLLVFFKGALREGYFWRLCQERLLNRSHSDGLKENTCWQFWDTPCNLFKAFMVMRSRIFSAVLPLKRSVLWHLFNVNSYLSKAFF